MTPAAQTSEPQTFSDEFMADYVRQHRCHYALSNVTLADWDRGVRAIESEAQRLTVERLPSDELLAEAMHSTRSVGHRSHALEECDTMNVSYMEAWAGRVRDWLAALAREETGE